MPHTPSYAALQRQVQALEADARRHRAFLNDILNYIPDLVFVKDERHRWVLLNDAFCAALGRKREDLIGKTDYDVHTREQADIFWEMDNQVFQSGGTNVNEEVYTDAQGELRTILTSKAAFRDAAGTKLLVGVAHDITERKCAERARADSEHRLAAIIEFLPDPTWVIDIAGKVISWNRAMERITGIAKRDIIGKGDYAYAIPFFGAPRPTLVDRVLAKGADAPKEASAPEAPAKTPAEDGYGDTTVTLAGRYFAATAGRLFNNRGDVVGAIGCLRDITDAKRMERERERLIAELKASAAKVRKLSGLLPICSVCKNIRDDKGYWNQLEAFLKAHSEIEFSHSICPDCAKRLYPGFDV